MEGRLRLITGNKGAAKTLWVVDQLFKEFEKDFDRCYFSDITHLAHTGIKTAPDDWRDIPDNSLIVYDEVQFKLLFSRHNSKRDTQILELTTMRKRGIEMWIITQRARFLNADVLGLVDEHVHLERNGKKTSKVFIFTEAEVNITKTKKLFAFDKYVYSHPQHLYGFYESIKDGAKHGEKSYLNKGVISTLITLALVIIFGGYFIYKSWGSNGMKISGGGAPEITKTNSVASPFSQDTDITKSSAEESTQDVASFCRLGVNVTKPECVKWFDELTKTNGPGNSSGSQTESYDSNKPYSYNHVADVQPSDFPRMSGVIQLHTGRLVAIDQQGNYMINVSQHDCKKWLNGYRPFNYFPKSSSAHEAFDESKVAQDFISNTADHVKL